MDLLYPSEKGANDTVKTVIHKLNSWIQTETDGDPENIVAGYELDGTPTQDYDDLCFTAPFLVAAACEDSASSWEQALWDTLADYGTDVYFGDTKLAHSRNYNRFHKGRFGRRWNCHGFRFGSAESVFAAVGIAHHRTGQSCRLER